MKFIIKENKNKFNITKNATEFEKIIHTMYICNEFLGTFPKAGDKLSFTSKIKHIIKTKNESSIHTKHYRYPYFLKMKFNDKLTKCLKN